MNSFLFLRSCLVIVGFALAPSAFASHCMRVVANTGMAQDKTRVAKNCFQRGPAGKIVNVCNTPDEYCFYYSGKTYKGFSSIKACESGYTSTKTQVDNKAWAAIAAKDKPALVKKGPSQKAASQGSARKPANESTTRTAGTRSAANQKAVADTHPSKPVAKTTVSTGSGKVIAENDSCTANDASKSKGTYQYVMNSDTSAKELQCVAVSSTASKDGSYSKACGVPPNAPCKAETASNQMGLPGLDGKPIDPAKGASQTEAGQVTGAPGTANGSVTQNPNGTTDTPATAEAKTKNCCSTNTRSGR